MQNIQEKVLSMMKPSRMKYTEFQLGQSMYYVQNWRNIKIQIQRIDYQTENERYDRIVISHYKIVNNPSNNRQIVVYCHSLGNCRLQAMDLVDQFMKRDYEFVTFDFRGHGLSGGEQVSYGLNESNDIYAVLQFICENLVKNQKYSLILYGRSMGAVACIIFNHQYHRQFQIDCLILDTPYRSFKQTILDVGSKKTYVPGFIIDQLLSFFVPQLEYQNDFKVQDLEIEQYMDNITCPVVFLGGNKDQIVNIDQVNRLYTMCQTQKSFCNIDQDHNEARSVQDIQIVLNYLSKIMPQKYFFSKSQLFTNIDQPQKQTQNLIRNSININKTKSKSQTRLFDSHQDLSQSNQFNTPYQPKQFNNNNYQPKQFTTPYQSKQIDSIHQSTQINNIYQSKQIDSIHQSKQINSIQQPKQINSFHQSEQTNNIYQPKQSITPYQQQTPTQRLSLN